VKSKSGEKQLSKKFESAGYFIGLRSFLMAWESYKQKPAYRLTAVSRDEKQEEEK
jgi:hypothetical protein